MGRLVPFPDEIGSLADADLLDLNVLVTADVPGGRRDRSFVEARARYATSARVHQVRTFYLNEFSRAGAALIQQIPPATDNFRELSFFLADDNRTRYDVCIDDFGDYRAVKVVVRYGAFDQREVFDRFARWHSGNVPVSAIHQPTALEISTFASGRQPNTLVLYSTYYACPTTPRSERRAMVANRMHELGWTYHEPREGIMFIQGGHFEAETHVVGDEISSNVTFVGEFQLR